MASAALRLVVPAAENGTVGNSTPVSRPPRRRKNAEVRAREYLTEAEVERLVAEAGRENRWGARDATMVLLAYRHGLRVSELCAVTWDQLELGSAKFHVRRRKNGDDSVHFLAGRELRLLRRLRRETDERCPGSRHAFVSERGGPLSEAGFRKTLARLAVGAGFPFPVHPHMLRHACGFKLANEGRDTRSVQAYLGHRNIQHTVRYTKLSPERFKGFWAD